MKRQLLFLMTLVISAFAWNAKAQIDVTSTYLQNADFSQSIPIAGDLRGYGKDMVSGDKYGFQAVDGWQFTILSGDNSNATYPNSGMGAAVFAYGSSYQLKGNNVTAPASGVDGSVNGLAFFAVWGCGGYYYQDVTLPAGEYTINIPIYCVSGTQANTTYTGFFPNSGTNRTVAINTTVGQWVTRSITFTLAAPTTGQIRLGYQSTGSGSGANPHLFFDKVQILYTAVVIKDALAEALAYATRINQELSSSSLSTGISNAQSVYNSSAASQDDVDNAVAMLKTVCATAITESGLTDLTFVFQNGDFSSTDGWTPVISGQYRDYGNGLIGTALGSYAASTTDETHLNSQYFLANQCRWSTNYSSWTQSVYLLPAGNYTVTFDVENTNTSTTSASYANRFYVTAGGTTYTDESTEWMKGATDWTKHTISFTLSEPSEIYLSLGYGTGTNNFGTANTPVLYTSHLSLNVVSDDEVLAAAKAAWEEARQAAIDATNDGVNDNVTGAEYAEISAEIAKAEPTTLEGYEEATQALIDATSAYTSAAPSYDALINEISKAGSLGVDTSDAQDVADGETTTAADAVIATQNLKVAEYNYVTSTFQYGVELGEWQSSGTNTNAAKFSNEHWSGTTREYLNQDDSNGQGWNANSWSLDVYQDVELPAGNYVFKAAGRIAVGDGTTVTLQVKNGDTVLGSVNDFPHNGNNARGITTSGETQFADGYTYANNGNGYGWEWRYVKFTLTETTTVRVAISAVATKNHEWFSIGDYTVNTDSEAGFALIDYNLALANAQAAQTNEDYANVAGVEKAALDAAVDGDATLDKTSKDAIEAATQALKDATTAFTAAKTAYDALESAITSAEEAGAPTANVGTGVFQIPSSAADAISAAIAAAEATQADATINAEGAEAAVATLQSALAQATEINAPAAGQRFNLVLKYDGYEFDNCAITYVKDGRSDAGNYNISYIANNVSYENSFTFTKVSGNNYTISQTDIDGNERYLCTGTVYGGNDYQIRTTTDSEGAAQFTVIPTATEGIYNIFNVAANQYVGSQDIGVYTVNSHIDFQLTEASQVAVALDFSNPAINYATRIFPFKPTLPTEVKAYTCEELDDATLVLNEVAEPQANVPYILGSESELSVEPQGWGLASQNAYTSGLLTGVYADTTAPAGSYVLQYLNDKLAFYLVEDGSQPTVTPYRAYLNAPASGIKAINFPSAGDATSIEAIEALTDGTAEIYNAAGQRVPRLERGMNIIRMSNGTVKKVLVK